LTELRGVVVIVVVVVVVPQRSAETEGEGKKKRRKSLKQGEHRQERERERERERSECKKIIRTPGERGVASDTTPRTTDLKTPRRPPIPAFTELPLPPLARQTGRESAQHPSGAGSYATSYESYLPYRQSPTIHHRQLQFHRITPRFNASEPEPRISSSPHSQYPQLRSLTFSQTSLNT